MVTKEYKPTYCASLLYFWAMMFVVSFPFLLLVAVVVQIEGQDTFGQVFFGSMAAMALTGVAFVLFVQLISFLIGLFTRKTVLLSDEAVTYGGKTIALRDIRSVTLYLPELSRTSSKPQTLMIWADNKNYMDIKRPSIVLVAALKKRCVFASFDVDDWKSHLKQCLWIQLGIIGFAIVAYMFGIK